MDDISGASAVGVPTLPPLQTFQSDGNGNLVPTNAVTYERKKVSEVDPAIRASIPSAVDRVAYPDHHPALREGAEFNANGAIKAGNAPTRMSEARGKARKREVDVQAPSDAQQEKTNSIFTSLETLEDEIDARTAQPVMAAPQVGQPKVKVRFEMPYADHTIRYHKAELSDRFLVLIYDTRAGDRDELVPKRVDNEDGDPTSFPITVYDESGKSAKLEACPINLNFEIDTYKFNVLFVTGKVS